MNRTDFLYRLEDLHVRVREGERLPDEALQWYQQSRTRLLCLAVEVQARSVIGDQRLRTSIRMGTSLPVLLAAGAWSAHTITCDVSAGGFAVLLEASPPVQGEILATLCPLHGSPLVSPALVVDARPAGGLVRVAFSLTDRSGAVRSRMEDVLLDGALEQLVFWDEVLDRLGG